jgi:hypothetical protein
LIDEAVIVAARLISLAEKVSRPQTPELAPE